MKKVLFLLAAVLCFSVANAQKGQMAAGVNLNFGLAYEVGSYNNIGLGAKFQYSLSDHFRLEPAFTYYLKKDNLSMWDLMVNCHYLFPLAQDRLNLYPIAGLGVLGAKASALGYSASTTKFGINLGGGAEYKISQSIALGVELKYQIVADYGHLALQLGVTYLF